MEREEGMRVKVVPAQMIKQRPHVIRHALSRENDRLLLPSGLLKVVQTLFCGCVNVLHISLFSFISKIMIVIDDEN